MDHKTNFSSSITFISGIILGFVVFLLDINLPYGNSTWVMYFIPLIIVSWKHKVTKNIYLLALLFSFLVLLKFVIYPDNIPSYSIFSRILFIAILFFITFIQTQRNRTDFRLEKANQALRESEDRFRLLSEELKRNQLRFERAETLAHVGSWVMDVRTGELEFSDEMIMILGLAPERKRIHISEYLKLVHPEDFQRLSVLTSKHHSEGIPLSIEYRIVRSDGEVRYIHGISGSEEDENKKPFIRYGAAKDITDRKTIEVALARERELFESIFSSIPVMITIYDPALKKFRFNEALYNILGWTIEDAAAGDFVEKVYPDPNEREEVSVFMQSLEHGWKEFTLTAKDGTRVESSWSNIRLDNGTLIGIGIDLRKIKQAEKTLRENQAKLIEAQKLAHIGSFTVDYEKNGIVEWSEEMFRIFERDIKKGNPTIEEMYNAFHPDDLTKVKAIIQVAKDEKRKSEVNYRIVISDNKIKYLHSIFNPVYGSSGKIIQLFGTTHDVTESMKQQEIIKEALEKLERSNRELEQFAYVASHDLQEPLRMVSSYMKLIEQRYKNQLDEKAKIYIEFAVDGSRRMADLIRDLLAYSRISSQAKKFEKVNLNSLFDSILSDLQVLIKETGAKVTTSRLPSLDADSTQIRQLFQNLIGNAIKFHSDRMPEVTVRAKEIENGWLFSVKDNGIGINSNYYERIFQIFQRLHERDKYSGTGIGLAVCKKIVERHGGRIWVESVIGKGTIFYFTIPRNINQINSLEKDNLEILSA